MKAVELKTRVEKARGLSGKKKKRATGGEENHTFERKEEVEKRIIPFTLQIDGENGELETEGREGDGKLFR